MISEYECLNVHHMSNQHDWRVSGNTVTTLLTCTLTYFLFDVTAKLDQHIFLYRKNRFHVLISCDGQVAYIL